MFNSTHVSVSHETTNNVKVTNEAQQQVLELRREHKDSFIVHCKVDDNVWKGLFYERPFLNRHVSSRADEEPLRFDGDEPDSYHADRWATDGQNEMWANQYRARTEKLISGQAVEVLQVKILDKTEAALVEVRWLDITPDTHHEA